MMENRDETEAISTNDLTGNDKHVRDQMQAELTVTRKQSGNGRPLETNKVNQEIYADINAE